MASKKTNSSQKQEKLAPNKTWLFHKGTWTKIDTVFIDNSDTDDTETTEQNLGWPEMYGYSNRPFYFGIPTDGEKAARVHFSVELYSALPNKHPKYPYMAYVAQEGLRQEVFFRDWPDVFLFLRQVVPIIDNSLWAIFIEDKLPTWDELSKRYAGPETPTADQS